MWLTSDTVAWHWTKPTYFLSSRYHSNGRTGRSLFTWAFCITANSWRVKKKGWVFLKHHFPRTKELNFRLQLTEIAAPWSLQGSGTPHTTPSLHPGNSNTGSYPQHWKLNCLPLTPKASLLPVEELKAPQVVHSLRETDVSCETKGTWFHRLRNFKTTYLF